MRSICRRSSVCASSVRALNSDTAATAHANRAGACMPARGPRVSGTFATNWGPAWRSTGVVRPPCRNVWMIHGSPARFDIISASMARVPRFLDVSVPLAPGIPTYPGNPPFEFEPVKRIANGDSANVSRMVIGTHTATHVDAPLHFFRRWRRRRRAVARPADGPCAGGRYPAPRRHHGRGSRRCRVARRSARAAQDTELALWNGGGPFTAGLHAPDRGRREIPGRARRESGRRGLSLGRGIQEAGRAGAPRLLSPGSDHHRRAQPLATPSRASTRCSVCRCASRAPTAPRRASSCDRAERRSDVLDDSLVIVLAGGAGERLYPLTKERAKPAVYFGGPYRIIDFALSNCINSGPAPHLHRHAVQVALAQPPHPHGLEHRRPRSSASSSRSCRRRSASASTGIRARPTRSTRTSTRSSARTRATSIVLSGDHVYKMDYAKMLRFHQERGAAVTLAAIEVPLEDGQPLRHRRRRRARSRHRLPGEAGRADADARARRIWRWPRWASTSSTPTSLVAGARSRRRPADSRTTSARTSSRR